MANNNATTTRPVNGGSGDDVMTGDAGANVISGGSGDDTITGAGGDDILKGDAGRDLLDGGAGSDRVDGHSEDDVLVYVAAENAGAHDEYDGGAGVDTLRLVLTREEWMRPAVQSDVAAFLAFISDHVNPSGQATAGTFAFTAFDLLAGKFERLEVTVDGVPLDPRDEAVTLAADAAQTDEDGSAAGAVLGNDSVPDLVRSVEVVVPPANGTLVFNADGTYVYTPGAFFNTMAAGETAIETFQYRVTDADFDSAIAMVTITITGTNDGPVVTNTAEELVGAVQEDGPLTAAGQLGATDADHNATQTWTVEGAPTGNYGSMAVDANGHWIYTLDNAAHQNLAQGESHDEHFTIRVTDDQGAFVDQVVSVTVAGTNDGPVITGGATSGSVTEDAAATQATGQLVADDPDHGAQQIWTVVGGTPSGSADYLFTMDRLTVTRNGQPYFSDEFSDGIPPPSGVAPFSYGSVPGSLSESGGRLVFDGANAISFVGVGTPDPIVGSNAVLRTNIDPASPGGLKSSTDFTVSGVFDLVEPDSPRETYGIRLTDRLVGGPGTPADQLGDNAIEVRVISRTNGTTIVAFRHLDFVSDTSTLLQAIALAPPPGADQIRLNLAHSVANVGQVAASFEYLSGGVVVGTQAFSAIGQIFQGENWTRAEVIASAPAMNDSTLGGTYGTLTVSQSGAWTYDIDNGRAATQALAQGQLATDTFTVRVADEFGAFDTRTIDIQVVGTNDGPIIQTADVSRALGEDANVTAGQLAATGEGQFSDVDLTDAHSLSAVLAAAQLSDGAPLPAGLAAALGGAVTTTLLDAATGDGHAQYRWDFAISNAATQFLAAGQTLQATYDVVATDSHGASAAQQVTVTIAGSNDAPVAVGDVLSATEDTSVTFSAAQLLANDSDADANAQLSIASVTSGTGGAAVRNADGSVTFTPNANFNGAASFSYVASDGTAQSSAASVAVNVAAVNDAPVAVDDANALTVKALPSGAPSNFVNWVDWTSASPGSVVGTIDLGGGQTIGVTYSGEFAFAQTNGGLNFYPDYDNNGSPTTTTYTSPAVQNGPSGSDIIALSQASQKTLTFSQPVNDLFFAIVSLNGNGYLFDQDFDVMSYGQGYFGNGTATRVALPDGRFSVVGNGELHGVLRIDGAVQSLTWTSQTPEYWNGFTVGTYGKALSATVSGNVLGNDSDVDGDALAVSAVNGQQIVGNSVTLDLASGARVQVNKDGTYLYDEDGAFGSLGAGQTAVDSFQYTVSDGQGGTATATARVTVSGVNDAAVVTGATSGAVAEDGIATASGLLAIADPDQGESGFQPATGTTGTYGAFSFDSGSGAWSYTLANGSAAVQSLAAGQVVTQALTVTSLDASATRTITVDIAGANDAPVVTGPVTGGATEGGTPVPLPALQNASDVDIGATLSVVGVPASLPAGVSYDAVARAFVLDPAHSAYAPLGAGQTQVITVNYGVSDGSATTAASVSWTVTGIQPVSANVGVYIDTWTSSLRLADFVESLGATALVAPAFTNAGLSGLDALVLDMGSISSLDSSQRTAVFDAVHNGMRLVVNDWSPTYDYQFMPKMGDLAVAPTVHTEVDVVDETSWIAAGPAGQLLDGTLDGGSSSTHGGYSPASVLAMGATPILSSAGNITALEYDWGAGRILFAGMPVGAYLDSPWAGQSVNDGMQIWLRNEIANALRQPGSTVIGNGTIGGGAGDDVLVGGAGSDMLIGGGGFDRMTGGGGSDLFSFAAPSGLTDIVTDFQPGSDDLAISVAGFGGGLISGALPASAFTQNGSGSATLSTHRFIYETDTGLVWFDPDGTGTQEAVAIVRLVGTPVISAGDFVLL